MATVAIKYVGTFGQDFDDRKALEIMSIFVPTNSYVDSAAYNGDPKSIYSTNVPGLGFDPDDLRILPMASTVTPMAIFEMAKAKAWEADKAGEARPTVTVTTNEGYLDELHFIQLKNNLAFQGGEQEYEVTITNGSITVTTPTESNPDDGE